MAVRTVGSKRYVCLGSNGGGSLAVYEKATLVKKPNRSKLYACVTVPTPLRRIIGVKQKYTYLLHPTSCWDLPTIYRS